MQIVERPTAENGYLELPLTRMISEFCVAFFAEPDTDQKGKGITCSKLQNVISIKMAAEEVGNEGM